MPPRAGARPGVAPSRTRAVWARLAPRLRAVRAWLRPPRRLRFTAAGGLFLSAAFAVGLAAVNTGNNLLYLLLGAMLGFVAVSGWLSEQMLRGLRVRRHLPLAATAGRPVRVRYEIVNGKRRLPSFGLLVGEAGRQARAFVPVVEAGATATPPLEERFPRRGVYFLEEVLVETTFPFGFFRKGRALAVPGTIIVRPRADLRVRAPRAAGERGGGWAGDARARAGARGEYRSLREYRPGDDPRDIHWRSTARMGFPVVREYDREDAQSLWLCLDLSHPPSEAMERAIEVAASVAAAAVGRGERISLVLPEGGVGPGGGAGHLELILDVLATVEPSDAAPRLHPPVERGRCTLVTTAGGEGQGWGDVLRPDDAREPADPAAPAEELAPLAGEPVAAGGVQAEGAP